MITLQLARDLLDAGVLWDPAPGDRFVVDAELLTEEVFWVSNLTVEVHHERGRPFLGFNGTTEWAMDSVTLDEALWLPREDQLRRLLGNRLLSVHRGEETWEVLFEPEPGIERSVADPDLECAYAKAVLTLTA